MRFFRVMKHRHNLEDIHGFKLYTKLGRKKSTTRIVCTPLLLEFLKAAWWRTSPAFWKQEADDEVSKTTTPHDSLKSTKPFPLTIASISALQNKD